MKNTPHFVSDVLRVLDNNNKNIWQFKKKTRKHVFKTLLKT